VIYCAVPLRQSSPRLVLTMFGLWRSLVLSFSGGSTKVESTSHQLIDALSAPLSFLSLRNKFAFALLLWRLAKSICATFIVYHSTCRDAVVGILRWSDHRQPCTKSPRCPVRRYGPPV
jgi:hypothetical protein